MSRALGYLSILLLLPWQQQFAHGKSIPNICHALLKVQALKEQNESVRPLTETLRKLTDFVEEHQDSDMEFLGDIPDDYMPEVATFKEGDDFFDVALVNARLNQISRDYSKNHTPHALSAAIFRGEDEIAKAIQEINDLSDLGSSLNSVENNNRIRKSLIHQLKSLIALSGLSAVALFQFDLNLADNQLFTLGSGVTFYAAYLVSVIQDLQSARRSAETIHSLNSFFNTINQRDKNTPSWATFHAVLKVSRKFLRAATKLNLTREVLEEELYRQASISNAKRLNSNSENSDFDEAHISVDFIYTKKDCASSELILILRTADSESREDSQRGTRQRHRDSMFLPPSITSAHSF